VIELISDPNNWLSLLTLTAMEIVLGIDNIVFISILVAKLPIEQQNLGRRLGLLAAMGMRLVLLFTITWVMGLTEPVFSVLGKGFSGRDLGGLFLVGKATHEIHDKLETVHEGEGVSGGQAPFWSTILQIMVLDIVFSLDSVITAVGMANHLEIMVVATVAAVGVMLIFAKAIGDFVNRHPTLKILALSFLMLIGVMLIAEGMGQHVNKAYIYFAMAFSLLVELINMRVRKSQPVVLHSRFEDENTSGTTPGT